MTPFDTLTLVCVVGAVVLFAIGGTMFAGMKGRQGEAFQWHWPLSWFIQLDRMRKEPGSKPPEYKNVLYILYAFIVVGITPTILRLFF